MTDTIEAVARAIVNGSQHPDRQAERAITAHTAALIAGAGELGQRLRSHTTAEDAWYDIDEAAATIAAQKAEIERLTEREAQAKLDGVRAGIEAAREVATHHYGDRPITAIDDLDAEAIAKGEG